MNTESDLRGDNTRFRIDSARVAHEMIDGEVIVIDIDSGTYYMLAGPAAEVWALLIRGHSVIEVSSWLRQRYDEADGDVELSVATMVEQFASDQIIHIDENAVLDPLPKPEPSAEPYTSPVITKFTDMEYMLALDPIHEVDQSQGWPVPKPNVD